jgi:hypothetical protein
MAIKTLDGYVGENGGLKVEYVSQPLATSSVFTGQITVSAAGTAVNGPDVPLTNGAYIKALGANAGKVYVGNDGAGDITSSNGFELSAGDLIIVQVSNLNQLWFDAATNGDKFCWMKA